MTQRMEVERWRESGALACRLEGAMLVGFAPRHTVGLCEDQMVAAAPNGQPLEQRAPFVVQYDMARFPGLARANMNGAAVRVEIGDGHCRQLAIARAGQQRRFDDLPEILLACVQEPPCLVRGQISHTRGISLREGADA